MYILGILQQLNLKLELLECCFEQKSSAIYYFYYQSDLEVQVASEVGYVER